MPVVYVAHGKRVGSLEAAKKLSKKLVDLNIPHDFRPKITQGEVPAPAGMKMVA